jgi:hypothetical protein
MLNAGSQLFLGAYWIAGVVGHLQDVACMEMLQYGGVLLDQDTETFLGDVPGFKLIVGFKAGHSELDAVVSVGG